MQSHLCETQNALVLKFTWDIVSDNCFNEGIKLIIYNLSLGRIYKVIIRYTYIKYIDINTGQ